MSHKQAEQETRITTERRGHVFLIGLDRADKRNAFDVQMLHELARAYTEYEDDDDLRCAVLHAYGDHFTGGLDLAKVAPELQREQMLFPEGLVDPVGLYGRRRSKPIISATKGWCLTIGIELSLACDIWITAQNARFGQIEIRRGIFPFGGATIRWPQRSGWGNAMRYLLTGEEFDAQEALRIGLVSEITTSDKLLDRAIELAELVAKQAPLGVRATLESAWLTHREGPEAAAEALPKQLEELMGSEDATEGMLSFIERRDAQFKGR